jgi:hypothetical protein
MKPRLTPFQYNADRFCTMTWTVPPDGGASSKWGEWLPLRPAKSNTHLLRLDLSNLQFVDPLFLVRLRAFLDWHSGRGHEIIVEPPRSAHVRNYLSRMGVGDDLPAGCSFDVGRVAAQPHPDVLISLTRLRHRHDAVSLDEDVADLLDGQFSGSLARCVDAFTMTVGEMCDNALSHGKSEHGVYVAAQRYKSTRCVLAIGDLGIPTHLRRQHPDLADDGDAIAEATKQEVTGVAGEEAHHRGNGYYHVVDEMQATKIPRGLLRVWSGLGRFSLAMTEGRQTMRRGWSTDEDVTCGTWVRLELASK